MLEASGLSANEQLTILTSVNNVRSFDKLSQAMMEQHPKIHVNVKPKSTHSPYHRDKGGKGSRGKGWSRYGNLGYDGGDVDDVHDEDDKASGDDSDGRSPPELLPPETDSDLGEECETKDDVELDVFACMLAIGAKRYRDCQYCPDRESRLRCLGQSERQRQGQRQRKESTKIFSWIEA